uniref:Uncharacterized protein n=1 Tax=Oryza sativa subsp. japonica TaxID=39947 RepID=Q6K3V3_ORYSJ|nr:hypothetical protein [Oryza sativa Japonica Group]BAD19918.1 hypothetical protein [Oryza sativa Japonica Group]
MVSAIGNVINILQPSLGNHLKRPRGKGASTATLGIIHVRANPRLMHVREMRRSNLAYMAAYHHTHI